VSDRHNIDKQREIQEAEAAKPLKLRRTHSPAEAKRELERTRAGIESTLEAMKRKVEVEVDDVRRRVDVPNRLRDRVREDPWRALALAAGVGLGLALLTSGSRRGYDALTKDEIKEIRAFRKERRRHMQRLEILLEDAGKRQARPGLRQRIRARLASGRDEKD